MSETTMESIGQRLAAVEDRLAITDLLAGYGTSYDDGDFERFADLFTADAQYTMEPDVGLLDLPLVGREAIAAAMRERRTMSASSVTPRHLTTNVSIRMTGQATATVSSFLVVIFAHMDGQMEVRRSGVYEDELRKEDDAWRFAKRHLLLDPAPPRHLTT